MPPEFHFDSHLVSCVVSSVAPGLPSSLSLPLAVSSCLQLPLSHVWKLSHASRVSLWRAFGVLCGFLCGPRVALTPPLVASLVIDANESRLFPQWLPGGGGGWGGALQQVQPAWTVHWIHTFKVIFQNCKLWDLPFWKYLVDLLGATDKSVLFCSSNLLMQSMQIVNFLDPMHCSV